MLNVSLQQLPKIAVVLCYSMPGIWMTVHLSMCRVLTSIQELGPPLGLHINIPKCEVFSCTGLSSFPPEMKQTGENILGVPIGSADIYSAFIFRKHAAVKQLLSSLKEVGAVDPHVGFTSFMFAEVSVHLSI